jgi:hypothetical protein
LGLVYVDFDDAGAQWDMLRAGLHVGRGEDLPQFFGTAKAVP